MKSQPVIHAVCHDCKVRHTYRGTPDELILGLGEWRTKHPRGRCIVDFLPDEQHRDPVRHVENYRHNADHKLAYGSSAAFTITLASLATSSDKTTGRESTAVANDTTKYLDYLIGGKISTGTTPTNAKSVDIYAYGAVNDTPLFPDTITGTDSGMTLIEETRNAGLRFFASTQTTATTPLEIYWFHPRSIAAAFGGIIPTDFGLWVTHDTGVVLHATASNHALYYTGIYSTLV